MTDDDFMLRAITLAEARLGLTGANPAVGCVIVKDGRVIGEATTAEGGNPHAEEQALAIAGLRAQGATAYVTLEPCAHRSAGGASCSSLLISHGVARVVIAAADPSIHAAGHGPAALEAAGIAVETGLLAADAARLYRDYRPQARNPLERPN